MNTLCLEMLESIASSSERRTAVSAVIEKLEETKRRGEEWGKDPKIRFSFGSMDERDLDERIADNTKVIGNIERRIAALKLWAGES